MQWSQEGEQIRCLRHAVLFGKTSICEACITDPPPADDEVDVDVNLPTPPAGCLTTAQVEAKLTSIADYCEAEARSALDDKDAGWHRYGAGTKLLDTAIKALRSAGAYASTREAEVLVRGRMKQLAKLASRVRH